MQNYRNTMNDCMRRGSYGRTGGMSSGRQNPQMPQTQYPAYHTTSPCCDRADELEGLPLAMAYVPWQNWKEIYDLEKGFSSGTIFHELDKPFLGRGGNCR